MSLNIETEVVIDAPPAIVWQVLAATEQYPEWNRHLHFAGELRKGNVVRMHARLFGLPLTFRIKIEVFDPQTELRWRGGWRWLFLGRHYLRLRPADGAPQRTVFVHGEDFEGIAAPLLLRLIGGELTRFYERINVALVARTESLAR